MVKKNNLYTQTRDQIKKLTSGATNINERRTMGLDKKNPKIHFSHLQGRRKKVIDRYQQQKSRAKEENIQYDSSSTLLNARFLSQIKQKHDFVKNKYKYSEVRSSSVGHYKQGVLSLSKFDLEKINGKEGEQ